MWHKYCFQLKIGDNVRFFTTEGERFHTVLDVTDCDGVNMEIKFLSSSGALYSINRWKLTSFTIVTDGLE